LDGLNAFRIAKVGGLVLFDDYLLPQKYQLDDNRGWSYHKSTKEGIDACLHFLDFGVEVVEEHYGEAESSQLLCRKTKNII
jgi:hypothetical protein